MAMKLFETWSWNRTLPEPFNDTSIMPRSKVYISIYNKATDKNKIATLHSSILSAILQSIELDLAYKSDYNGAYGMQGKDLYISEYPSHTGEIHAVVFNNNTGKFTAGCYDDITQMPKPYSLKENGQSGAALFFALVPLLKDNEEFNYHYMRLSEQKSLGFPSLEKAAEHAYILCDNVYRRINSPENCDGDEIVVVIPNTGNIQPFTTINLSKGTYCPDVVYKGDFKVLLPNTSKKNSRKSIINHSDFVSRYKFDERDLTANEQALVPSLPSWYVIPREIEQLCKHAYQTTKSNRPMRNFSLRGNAGTGKTEGAKAIAAGFNLPYVHLTCSSNTEIFDILGQMMPIKHQSKSYSAAEYPTFEDIRMDASTAYFKLTGEYIEGISEDFVYEKLLEVISYNANKNEFTKDIPKFEYVESPLIQAMRYGYVIELQEPTVISNPGVLVGLNSLLDGCGTITLPTGEQIKRHPDTVVVVTTNIGYEGCRSLNQSIISRMDLIIDMPEPDVSTLTKRVIGITGCKEKDNVKKMANIMNSIQERCHMNMIDDGCCGVRELISWVQSYMVCGDMMEAAKYTILPSVSADEENREDILSSCIEPVIGL